MIHGNILTARLTHLLVAGLAEGQVRGEALSALNVTISIQTSSAGERDSGQAVLTQRLHKF